MPILFLRSPTWRLSFGEARFYGWRLWITVGPWMLLIGRVHHG